MFIWLLQHALLCLGFHLDFKSTEKIWIKPYASCWENGLS